MRSMERALRLMKDAVRSASVLADGMASEPPGWKSFWMSMRSSVVMTMWRVGFGFGFESRAKRGCSRRRESPPSPRPLAFHCYQIKNKMHTLILLPPSLSLLYAASVHLFLTSFHERHITHLKHWQPILIRFIYFAIIGLVTWLLIDEHCSSDQGTATEDAGSCYWNVQANPFRGTYHASVTLAAAVVNLFISACLILETRRSEVDGPIPPLPATEKPNATGNSKPLLRAMSMKDKVVLITGANAGIGLETARQLYQRGAIVVLACRSRHRAEEAMNNIDSTIKLDERNAINSSKKKCMHFLPLDLTSIASVKKAAELFDEMKLPLHVLINNAGVMRQKKEVTEDGIEMTMAANVSKWYFMSSIHTTYLLHLF